MSTTLSAAAIAGFASEIKHAYQDMGKLRDTVVLRHTKSSTYRFPKLGAGLATVRVPQTDVVPMNLAHTNQTATLEDWNAAEYTDIFDDAATNVSERAALAKAIAGAITRREDQLIIDGLEAASTTLTVAKSVGGTDTSLNLTKLRQASRLLGDQGVGDDEPWCYAGSHHSKEGLLGDSEATSADYASVRALVNGQINSYMGFDFKWIATRSEGGLDLTSNSRMNFAYAKSSMGLAEALGFKTSVDWIPQKTAWLANGILKAGVIDIDALGIVELLTHEA